jgi:transposase
VPSPNEDRRIARRRASILFAQGVSRADVARALGVSRSTTTRWHRAWRDGGEAALLAGGPRGRPPRLDAARLERLEAALRRPPREAGYDLDRWSLAAVAALIERVTGERHHRRHAGRLLRRMGWVIPPVGKHADQAFRRRAVADPDGNVIGLFEERPLPRER